MDFHSQAKAIWAALDEMSEKDPEHYKEFINDQLRGDDVKDMLKQFGQLGLGGNSGSGQDKKSSKSNTNNSVLGQNDFPSTSSYKAQIPTKKRSVLTAPKGRLPSTVGSAEDSAADGPSTSSAALRRRLGQTRPPNSLLDDSFAHPHSSINPTLVQVIPNKETEADEPQLTSLNLPERGGGDSRPKKSSKKPLIEEL